MPYSLSPLSPRILSAVIFQAQRIQQRIAALKTDLNFASKLPPIVYERRHKSIFPPGFDFQSSSSQSQLPNAFTLRQLYHMLTERYDPNEPVESIIVRSVSFGKLPDSVQHEFLLIEVEETSAVGLKNYLVLDRNNGGSCQRSGLASISHPSQSISGVAKDELRVSWNGDRSQLLELCGLKSHVIVEEIKFSSEKPLLFYQLVALAFQVSITRLEYHLGTGDCYWFAGLIWECILQISPEVDHKHRKGRKGLRRGKLRSLPHQTIDNAEIDVTCDHARSKFAEMKLAFTTLEEKWIKDHNLDLKREHEEMLQKLADLERKLEALDPRLPSSDSGA